VEKLKKLFNDPVFGFFLRGIATGLCVVVYDGFSNILSEIRGHDREITRITAKVEDLEERLKELETK